MPIRVCQARPGLPFLTRPNLAVPLRDEPMTATSCPSPPFPAEPNPDCLAGPRLAHPGHDPPHRASTAAPCRAKPRLAQTVRALPFRTPNKSIAPRLSLRRHNLTRLRIDLDLGTRWRRRWLA